MLRKVFRIENSVEINFGRKNHQVFHARPTVGASGQYFGAEKTPSHAYYVADSQRPVRASLGKAWKTAWDLRTPYRQSPASGSIGSFFAFTFLYPLKTIDFWCAE